MRTLHPDTKAELLRRSGARPITLCRFDFTGSPLYVWANGNGQLSWDSKTWTGLYPILQISGVAETSDSAPGTVRVRIAPIVADKSSGSLSSLITAIRAVSVRGTPALLYQGFLSATGTVVNTPFLRYAGRISVPTIKLEDNAWVLELTCVRDFEGGDRATQFAETPGRLAAKGFPNDTAFGHKVEGRTVAWPEKGYWTKQKGP